MRLLEVLRGRRWVALFYSALAGAATLVGALALTEEGLAVGTGHFWWIALGSIAVLVTLVARAGVWTATGAYAAVFWCFHFGLVSVLASGLVAPADLSLWDQMWILGPFAADAALVALIGFAAFAAGASLVGATERFRRTPAARGEHWTGAHPHGTAGAILVFIAILLWCAIVVFTGGLAGFFGSYGEYLHATSELGGPTSLVWLALGCGVVMAVTGRRGPVRTTAIAGFGAVTLVALPLGLRGEIMFPSIAALVAAARCGWVVSPGRACALVAGLLIVIPSVREVRTTGLRGLPDMVLELRMFDAFAEMGGSLHPVEKVVRWRSEGEPLEMGASYWAPIERAAARVLPGVDAAAAEDDMRIMNVLVTDRVGAIGFSPVAEAYRNFGAPGVMVILAMLGAAMAAIDRIADRRLAVLAIATLYVPLLTNVRNSFVSVPLQCGLGILFVAGLVAMRHVAASVSCRPAIDESVPLDDAGAYARSPYL